MAAPRAPAAAGPTARPAGAPPGTEVTRWAPGTAELEGKPGQVSPRAVSALDRRRCRADAPAWLLCLGGGHQPPPAALPSGTRLCTHSQAPLLHVGAAVLGWCPQPRCAIRGLSGSGTDLGLRRGAQPAADETHHLQSKADPPAARPRSDAAQHPRGSCSQPTGSNTVWAETRYVEGFFPPWAVHGIIWFQGTQKRARFVSWLYRRHVWG